MRLSLKIEQRSRLLSAVRQGLAFTKALPGVKKLRASRKLRDVRKIRARSHLLRDLRERLTAQLSKSRCVVLGSAPGVALPQLSSSDRVICVNGSPYVANCLGIADPAVTVLAGVTTALRSEKSRATIPLLKGLRTRELLFVETLDTEEHARTVLSDVGFGWDRFTSISTSERAAVIGEVCGVELGLGGHNDKVSNGIFAITLASWAGADEIVMCGFSLEGGHSYLEGQTSRHNLNGDSAFFAIANQLKIGLSTTALQLHKAFGIPLADTRSSYDVSPNQLLPKNHTAG
jgi:hypothetical protein